MTRFWGKVSFGHGPGACWMWKGAVHHIKGHGKFWVDGRACYAHLVSLALCGVEIPAGRIVHHVCENPSCVNPSHLRFIDRGEHTRLHKPRLGTGRVRRPKHTTRTEVT